MYVSVVVLVLVIVEKVSLVMVEKASIVSAAAVIVAFEVGIVMVDVVAIGVTVPGSVGPCAAGVRFGGGSVGSVIVVEGSLGVTHRL